ncbi:MAG: hypothetical protein LBE24_03995 [Methylobacillus sp.]|jgi:hypothetical protein|nr:hypothetical protein [Methylobacillus sp.]
MGNFAGLFPDETQANLVGMLNAPRGAPDAPPAWSGFGDALGDIFPYTVAEGVNAFSHMLDWTVSMYESPMKAAGWASEQLSGENPYADFNEFSDALHGRIGEIGAGARSIAEKSRPDPLTTGYASNMVFGLGSTLGKGVAYMGAAGPVAGAALFGTDVGVNERDRLIAEGVDPTTATEVGISTGIINTGLMAIPPAVGATRLASAGWGGVIGFGGGIIDPASTKLILQGAGYDEIAAQYQPLDPMNLAISTIVSAGAGALFHGAGRPREPQAPKITPDELAATLTVNELLTRNDDLLVPKGDIQALDAGRDAQDLARQQLDDGEPVSVATTVDADPQIVVGKAQSILDRMEEQNALPVMEHWPRALAADQRLTEEQRAGLSPLFEHAEQTHPAFSYALNEIAERIGARAIVPAIKFVSRTVDKLVGDYKGITSEIKDILRGAIEVRNYEEAQAVVVLLREKFGAEISPIKDRLHPDSSASASGYRDINLVFHVNGGKAEVQINFPEMLEAKKKTAPLYEKWSELRRKIDSENRIPTADEQARLDKLNASQIEIHQAAWDKAMRRINSSREMKLASLLNNTPEILSPEGQSRVMWSSSQANDPLSITPNDALAENVGNATGRSDISNTSNQSVSQNTLFGKVIDAVSGLLRRDTQPLSDFKPETPEQARAMEVAASNPDAMIPTGELGADGKPVYARAADLMQRAAEVEAATQKDAAAFDAAVNCSLRNPE